VKIGRGPAAVNGYRTCLLPLFLFKEMGRLQEPGQPVSQKTCILMVYDFLRGKGKEYFFGMVLNTL